MLHSHPLKFANQDLRNHSFKGQNLNGADFSGSDIRGCDFSYASLQGANFERVKVGQTPRQFITVVGVAVVVALLAVDAIARMIFGSLGRTPGEPAWAYILALYISMGIAGVGSGIRGITGTKSIAGRIATVMSGTASGALLGFFYGGSTTGNNPQIATAAAVLGGMVMAVISFRARNRLVAVAVSVAGAVAGYGFAFLVGTIAIAFLSVQKLVGGVVWGILSLGFLRLTMNSLTFVARDIRSFSGTSFKGADLTNAVFDVSKLQE
ncbi:MULTISPECIES: pentapeptide repeat-containing protein [unclassified Coleofasciculus]|uniref:pentapeptide repeat-containing protein n=1 Tax=unclassified Coleofasciculus TaxID=2692782 RepID=UPI001881A91E|nr:MULTISPECIES: pentapeptide repeat-containing protein [unclassified Coleofasciculus]MBE9126494.1 pentapeptide repeat-containing protein [Coleofasciculus sp. LEGE 07081]MBE9149909.1 pentapeptide repeat-containing protein [Coleofasciculus sp. LEGE 07092]